MQGLLIAVLVAAFTLYVDHNAEAHHSFTAEFDRNQPIEIQGVVTKVEWTNPHVWVYVNVEDENGKVTLRRVDPKDIMLEADEMPDDVTFSEAIHVEAKPSHMQHN